MKESSTMPTNDERHEVAARLRMLAYGYKEASAFSVVTRDKLPTPIDSLMRALGLTQVVEATEVFYRMASLIEPEPERTCCPVIEDGTEVCSNCGYDIDGYGWSYCPNCGTKLVEE